MLIWPHKLHVGCERKGHGLQLPGHVHEEKGSALPSSFLLPLAEVKTCSCVLEQPSWTLRRKPCTEKGREWERINFEFLINAQTPYLSRTTYPDFTWEQEIFSHSSWTTNQACLDMLRPFLPWHLIFRVVVEVRFSIQESLKPESSQHLLFERW